jgi:hypothetical protein
VGITSSRLSTAVILHNKSYKQDPKGLFPSKCNTKVFSTQQNKIHMTWHPFKNYQVCKTVGK